MNAIKVRLNAVQKQIADAARRSGRSANDITLVGVTKNKPVEHINQAISAGLLHIGENRIQEAREKLPEIHGSVTRHMIGHLQRNKVKYAVKLFEMIQSIDTISLAEDINARCAKMNHQMPVLIEVNTSGEESKIGCKPTGALTLLRAIDRLPNLSVRGFMTIAIFSEDAEQVRPCFRMLRQIYEEAKDIPVQYAQIHTLSMGMSSDFEVALEEGSTMVRIGSAIFGGRT